MTNTEIKLSHPNQKISKELPLALASVFVLIAGADSNVCRDEKVRFISIVTSLGFDNFPSELQVKNAIDELQQEIRVDAQAGKELLFAIIKKVKNNKSDADLILSIAQAVLVADKNTTGHEEYALQLVCEALGVNPEEYCVA